MPKKPKEPVDIFENIEEELLHAEKQNIKIVRSNKNVIELRDGKGWYEIELSRCDTHEKLVHWTYHLTSKTWVTPKHIHLFLSHAFGHFPKLAPN